MLLVVYGHQDDMRFGMSFIYYKHNILYEFTHKFTKDHLINN